MIYESFNLELFIMVLELYSYCGNEIRTSFKLLALRRQENGAYRDFRVSINLHKNNVLQFSHGIKNIYQRKL